MEMQRESVFIATLKTFCRMFFGVVAILLAFISMSLLYNSVSTTTIESKTKMKYLPDAEQKKELVSTSAPVILQINVHGVIGDKKCLDTRTVENILVESRTGDLKNNRVKGVLLHMNTPGGTVVDSDNIYRLIKEYKQRYKVPVFAYVDGLCASGGMYIMCSADQIFAGHASIVGSVGVIIGPFFNVFDTLTQLGMKMETITEGLDKDMMTPFRPWKADEDASLKAVTAYFYQQFVEVVTSNRPINKTKLVQQYGAKVFDPITAQSYGYVDHIGATRDSALLALLKEANIDPAKAYQVVTLEPKNEWLSDLFNERSSTLFTGKIEHTFDLGQPKIKDQIAYLYSPLEN